MNLSPPPKLPPIIAEKLRLLRRALRNYMLLNGLAITVSATILLLAGDLALDRFFEFSLPLRAVLLLALVVLASYVIWRRIIRGISAKIRDEQWAFVVEHFVPGLNESLVTAVEPGDSCDFDQTLFEQTVRQAAEGIRRVDHRKIFRYGRLASRIFLSVAALGVGIGFCATFSETAEIWFSRNILLSSRDWPRRSHLRVVDFEDGKVRVGRGDSFTLIVQASTTMPLVPDVIRLRLGSSETGFRTVVLDQFRLDAGDGFRVFSHTFSELLETLPFSVHGADSTIAGLEIEVVPSPMLTEVKLTQDFPPYMDRPSRTVAATNRATVPDGTSVTMKATANKDLTEAAVVTDGKERVVNTDGGSTENLLSPRERGVARSAAPVLESAPAFRSFQYGMETLRRDTRIEFYLRDTDSLRNRRPIRYDFTVLRDNPPLVTARLDGVGSAITPNAVLPATGEISDDYGIAAAAFRYEVERSATSDAVEQAARGGTVPITGLGATQTVFPLSESFSVADCDALPGDGLTLWIEASDRFNLNDAAGQTGQGPRWSLEMVTPERLRSLLEVREIALRQRFDVLLGEVELTKELIETIGLDVPEELAAEAEKLTLPVEEDMDRSRNRQDAALRREELEAELARKRKALLETITKEQGEAARYNISRSLRDTQKECYEIKTMIESFRLIRAEMVNNRIFTDDDATRLDGGIVFPLQGLVDTDFPALDNLVKILDATLAGALASRDQPLRSLAVRQKQETVTQFDELLEKMRRIRDSMVTMESFNEAIDMLRAILRQQRQIRQETVEEKNKRLKSLLE